MEQFLDVRRGIAATSPRGKVRVWQTVLATTDEVAPLLARVTMGAVMLPHGAQKFLGWFGGQGIEGTIKGMSGMGIPPALAMLAIIAEFFGALGLISGALSRVAALGLGVVMVVAALMHLQVGFFMNWFGTQKGEGFEYHLLALGLIAIVLWRGGGLWSLDRLITRRLNR